MGKQKHSRGHIRHHAERMQRNRIKLANAFGMLEPWGEPWNAPADWQSWLAITVGSYRKRPAKGGCNCMMCKGYKRKGFAKRHRRKGDLVEKARMQTNDAC